MNSNEKQNGQVLAQVALMMVVLLGFLALAVDVSQVYLKRRQLQNAADAAALESARWICFVDENDQGGAINSAGAVARAQFSDPDPSGFGINITFPGPVGNYTTTVVVNQVIPSFVASIVGQETFNPGARATAICGSADRGVGGIWPIALNIANWNSVGCGEIFAAWQASNQSVNCSECDCNRVYAAGNNITQIYFPTQALYDQLTTFGAPIQLSSGQSGWLNLPDPAPPMPLPTCGYANCGAAVACFLSQPHPGPINVCDLIATSSGSVSFNSADKAAVRYHADRFSEMTIPLWDDSEAFVASCPALTPAIGTNCPTNRAYPVAGFGCIEVLGYSTKAYVNNLPGFTGNCQNTDLVVIFARKLCDCASSQGGAGSGPPGSGVRAVSLIE